MWTKGLYGVKVSMKNVKKFLTYLLGGVLLNEPHIVFQLYLPPQLCEVFNSNMTVIKVPISITLNGYEYLLQLKF